MQTHEPVILPKRWQVNNTSKIVQKLQLEKHRLISYEHIVFWSAVQPVMYMYFM